MNTRKRNHYMIGFLDRSSGLIVPPSLKVVDEETQQTPGEPTEGVSKSGSKWRYDNKRVDTLEEACNICKESMLASRMLREAFVYDRESSINYDGYSFPVFFQGSDMFFDLRHIWLNFHNTKDSMSFETFKAMYKNSIAGVRFINNIHGGYDVRYMVSDRTFKACLLSIRSLLRRQVQAYPQSL